jgi:hypothetical protein
MNERNGNKKNNKINNKMSYKALEQGYQLYTGSRPYFYIDDEEVSRLKLAQVLHLFYIRIIISHESFVYYFKFSFNFSSNLKS